MYHWWGLSNSQASPNDAIVQRISLKFFEICLQNMSQYTSAYTQLWRILILRGWTEVFRNKSAEQVKKPGNTIFGQTKGLLLTNNNFWWSLTGLTRNSKELLKKALKNKMLPKKTYYSDIMKATFPTVLGSLK